MILCRKIKTGQADRWVKERNPCGRRYTAVKRNITFILDSEKGGTYHA